MEQSIPGVFGKMPGRGDFVTRRLNRSFLDAWDSWLQNAVADSKNALGGDWLNTYLTSPLWRFVLSSRVCGDEVWAGVIMPSVDRVGRYFPLTVAVPLAASSCPIQIAIVGGDWFDRAEEQLLKALDENDFDLDVFDREVEELGEPAVSVAGCSNSAPTSAGPARAIRVGLESVNQLGPALYTLLSRHFEDLYNTYSLWWTAGSDLVTPSLAVCQGLPAAEAYTSLLAGRWQDHLWLNLSNDVPAPVLETLSDVDEAELPV